MFSDKSSRRDTFIALQDAIQRPPKRLIYGFLGLLVLYVIVRGVVGAAARPFWYDELLTLVIAGQPTVREMWNAVTRGLDAMPPGLYLVERAALGFLKKKEIALRLPSILAFPCTLICVFVYAKKRSGEVVAFLCVLLLLTTSLFHTYLIEARPYGMLMACIAFALVCYQRLPSLRWAALLGISLLLAESFHYYAVFAMIPFGLAEAVLLLTTRRFRWPAWMALACGALPLIVFWPLLWKIKTNFGDVALSRPAFSVLPGFYGSYFFCHPASGVALAAVAAAAIVWWRFWPRTESSRQTHGNDVDLAEGTLLLSLIAQPVIAFVLIRQTHGSFFSRYGIAATIGIALGLACALSISRPRAIAAFGLFVLTSVAVRELGFWRRTAGDPFAPGYSAGQVEKLVERAGHGDLPVAVGQVLTYAPLAYYSPPGLANKLVYMVNKGKDLNYGATDSLVKAGSSFPEIFPTKTVDYSEFAAPHREFLLYSEAEDSWQDYLSHEAASMQLLAAEGDRRVYLVKMKERSAR
ncbi:MAG TPA: glycosyltransferase family 39 protein [Candidatus Acidoferrum sp.]|nr:glycosyltransferase family 39 protein [Candidatus Acidoferrum sp.]